MVHELDEDDRSTLATTFARLGVVEVEAARAAMRLFHARTLARGEYLLRAGEQARFAGVLCAGVLREHFVTAAGVERTKSFVVPLQLTGSLADLLSEKPSRAFIVAEQPSRVLLAAYTDLRALERAWPAWAELIRRGTERLLVHKAEREYQFLCLDAEARYASFLAQHPELEGLVAGRHIASYLGITPVHLSRLRRRRVRPQRTASGTS